MATTVTPIPKQSSIATEKNIWLIILFCGVLLALSSFMSFWLQLPPLSSLGLVAGSATAPFFYGWLVRNTSFRSATLVLGTVFMTGFMGSFVGVIDFVPLLYNRGRWVVPLFALGIGVLQIVFSRDIWRTSRLPWGRLSPTLLLFLFYAFASVLYSSAPLTTLGRALTFTAITYGTGAALFAVLQRVEEVEQILLYIALLMALVILPGEFYIAQPDSIGWHSSGRFRSTFWNPVTFGHLCALLLPLYWWLLLKKDANLFQRGGALGMIGVLLLNLYLAGSRGAVLALLIIIPLLAWHFIGRRARWLLFALSCTVVLLALPLQSENLLAFFTRGATWLDNYYFYSGRLASWQRAIELWSQSPIFGYGFGSIGNTDATLLRETSVITGASATAGLRLSNVYLEILASGGTVGALLFFYLLIRAIRILLPLMQRPVTTQQQQHAQRLITMAVATIAGGLVLNLTETWLISAGSPFAMYWWLVLFLAIRVITIMEASERVT